MYMQLHVGTKEMVYVLSAVELCILSTINFLCTKDNMLCM